MAAKLEEKLERQDTPSLVWPPKEKFPDDIETLRDHRPFDMISIEELALYNQHRIEVQRRIDAVNELALHYIVAEGFPHPLFDDEDSDDDIFGGIPFELPSADFAIEEADCSVCMSAVKERCRPCCNKVTCNDCMVEYITMKIQDGNVHFTCPEHDCSKPVSRDEIVDKIKDESLLEKYRRFVTNANGDPNKKTCPNCCSITEANVNLVDKFGYTVICEQCSFSWCFQCHSPSHEGTKCKDNMKGVKALREWTKRQTNGQRNARKCPKCQLLIQRTGGCDHMKCTQCKTNFCYGCGGRQLKARFLFGNHYEKLSILGCPKNFMGGRKKHLRRFVRGTIFSGKLLAATIMSAVLVGLLPVAVVAVIFGGPAIGFVRLHRYLKRKKRSKYLKERAAHSQKIHQAITDYYDREMSLRSRRLQPRRDMGELELDHDQIEDLVSMLVAHDLIEAEQAAPEQSELGRPTCICSSPVTEHLKVHVAEKDEVTAL